MASAESVGGPRNPTAGLTSIRSARSSSGVGRDEDDLPLLQLGVLDQPADDVQAALLAQVDADEADLVVARYWGPGRVSAALHAAVDEGRGPHVARGR
jgi:hypothetical protein